MDIQDAFTKITKEEDKDKILFDLTWARGEILCKGTGDAIFKLKAFRLEKERLYCAIQRDSPRPVFSEEAMIANFTLGGEKYFFSATGFFENDDVYFSVGFDLFHLQRRQNYRVKIPVSYKAHVEFSLLNARDHLLKGSLYDISSGGCRIVYEFKESTFDAGDLIQADILIGAHSLSGVTGIVRHAAFDPTNKKRQTLGIEFNPVSTTLESRIFGITMDLHRELFSKIR